MSNFKYILIMLPLIALMWGWNAYVGTLTGPLTTFASTLSTGLADTPPDTQQIMDSKIIMLTKDDDDLQPCNIRKGIQMFNKIGAFEGEGKGECEGQGQGNEGEGQGQGNEDNQSRFNDNEDGTVTDNKTRLIWLKKADWVKTTIFQLNEKNAHDYASSLKNDEAGLSDGSKEGDWRLPTILELHELVWDNKTVLFEDKGPFTRVQQDVYCSSSTPSFNMFNAWFITLETGHVYTAEDTIDCYVWPVKSVSQETDSTANPSNTKGGE